MDYRSTLIRSVEIPTTLPPMNTLTDLAGSMIIKDVATDDNGVRVEGDLLWRGYFEEGGGDCLWEGAEYFTEIIPTNSLRDADATKIEPKIMSMKGESVSDDIYRLTFDIRWFEDETQTEPTEHAAEELPKTTATIVPAPAPAVEEKREEPKPKTPLEEKLERIDETWRETVKTFYDTENEETPAADAAKDPKEEQKTCPYSKYCLRYYRTREGDELERIAEKFSATVAKLKEFNRLDSTELSTGRMLRIP